MEKEKTPFKIRCENDPQGVIKDLLSQITKQAKEIHERGEKIKDLEKHMKALEKKAEKLEKEK